MAETSEELPNFSIGIDLLGPDPTSSKNKAENSSPPDRQELTSLSFRKFVGRPAEANFDPKTFTGHAKHVNFIDPKF